MTDDIDEALYLRISTDEDRQNFDTQKQFLERFCQSDDPEIYKDDVSGQDFNRPELNQLLEDAKAGKIDKIIVAELTRLGRSLIDLETTLDQLEAWGIDFKAIDIGVDTSTTSGRLVYQIIGAVAEYERKTIKERVKRGLERARAEGKELGRPCKEVPDRVMSKVHKLRNLSDPVTWDEIYDRVEDEIDCSQTSLYRKYQKEMDSHD